MSEPVMQRMKISREGVLLIKSFEGFRPRAIRRDDGRWVVGYGHTASAREGAAVSEADAELLLQYDLIPVQAALTQGLNRAVNQHQYDALASFAFSVGVDKFRSSDVLAQVNSGAEGAAADALVAWPEPPIRDAGLRRRAAERALFTADPAAPVTLSDLLAAPLAAPIVAPEAEAFADTPLVEDSVVETHAIEAPAVETPVIEAAIEDIAALVPAPTTEAIAEPIADIPQTDEPALPEAESASVPAETLEAATSDEPVVEVPIFAPTVPGATPVVTEAVEISEEASTSEAPPALEAEITGIEFTGAEFTGAVVTAVTTEPLATDIATAVEAPIITDLPQDETLLAVEAPATPPEGFSPPPIDVTPVSFAPSRGPIPLVIPDVATADPFAHAPSTEGTSNGSMTPASPIVWPAMDEVQAKGELAATGAVAESAALASPRLVWPQDQGGDAEYSTARIEDQGALDLSTDSAAWSDPFDAKPAGFSWRKVWAYLVMGGFGLVSLAIAMAGLRKASLATADVQSTLVIAGILAVIGAACVGVSAYNIYQRLSDDR